VQAWNLLVTIAGQHLLPALLASALIWAALALLFRPGRVRPPAHRTVFLYRGERTGPRLLLVHLQHLLKVRPRGGCACA